MIENEHLDCVKVPLSVKCDGGSCAVGMKENNIQIGISWELTGASMDVACPLSAREPRNKWCFKSSLQGKVCFRVSLPLILQLAGARSMHLKFDVNHTAYFGGSWDTQHYSVHSCLLTLHCSLCIYCPFFPRWCLAPSRNASISNYLLINSNLGQKTKIFIFIFKIYKPYLPNLRSRMCMIIVLTMSVVSSDLWEDQIHAPWVDQTRFNYLKYIKGNHHRHDTH